MIDRNDFPLLNDVSVYADSAATSLKPASVINSINDYYSSFSANVHRGVHDLSMKATSKYEESRSVVANFLNASSEEVIFTRSATDSLNMVARMLKGTLGNGDEIVLSVMEHHSNLVPWQELAKETGAILKFVSITPDFELDMNEFENVLSKKTKIVAITHCSNVLGTIVDIKKVCELAHKFSALVVVDAAQSVAHMPIDVKELKCDFLVFSAHKLVGPTGVGVLFGKRLLLDMLPPVMFGGDMIEHVSFSSSTWNIPPLKFEAGTPPIAQVLGLAESINYVNNVGFSNIVPYEKNLRELIMKNFSEFSSITLFAPKNGGLVFSFVVSGLHSNDVAQLLNSEHVFVRSGHLCAMPLVNEVLKVDSVVRASFSWYNNESDIGFFFEKLRSVLKNVRN